MKSSRHAAALCLSIWLLSSHATALDPAPPRLLVGPVYPIEVSVSLPAGLLHWLDSLTALEGAGFTAGKTQPAHRLQYARTFGDLDEYDRKMLVQYREARLAFTESHPEDRYGLTRAFFEAAGLPEALIRSRELVPPAHADAFLEAIRLFAPRYVKLWKNGRVPERFLRRSDENRRRGLASFLERLAAFFGVPAVQDPAPRLILVPVPDGHGTHAQAIGHFLLIEVREHESLADEIAPIVHENAHFLYARMAPERREALHRQASQLRPRRSEAWSLLHEALPTAIAQGVAQERLGRRDRNSEIPWYHVEAIDRYAKRIYPLVRQALDEGGRLDEALLTRLLEAY